MPRVAAATVAAVAAAVVLGSGAGSAAPRQVPAIRLRVLHLVDPTRRVDLLGGSVRPRVLTTYVRYRADLRGPHPLVVFGHGYNRTSASYSRLLDRWAGAGYVVAAPTFPGERPDAPGGADEADLVNEPRDFSFVITRLTQRASPLHTLVDPTKIAVAGQSDGAEAALTVAYDRRYRDRRIDAALVLSGAAFPGFVPPAPGAPPLLAVQGTSDSTNAPATTSSYYRLMRRPKLLLWLLGAAHLPPYISSDRWARVVDRTSVAFLDYALRGASFRAVVAAGNAPGTARVEADP